jgi:anti-sigma factor RsiW
LRKQVVPSRIECSYQVNFSASAPTLQLLLASDGYANITRTLVVDQACHSVTLGEAVKALAMLGHAEFQVVRDADIEPPAPARKEVDPVLAHALNLQSTAGATTIKSPHPCHPERSEGPA